MATSTVEVVEFVLAQGGPASRLSRRLGFELGNRPRHFSKVLLLILVTWVPLLLLSFLEGHALGGDVAVPLLRDPVVYSRFLFVVPLLVLAQVVVERSLGAQARYFVESGIVPEHDAARCEAAKRDVLRMSGSAVAEGVIIALAMVMSIGARVVLRIGWGEFDLGAVGNVDHPGGLVVRPDQPADPVLLPVPLALGVCSLGLVSVSCQSHWS